MGETGFCKNLRFSAVSCDNLRFPAVFCANLRLPNPLIYRASRKSAKICKKSAKMCVPGPVSPSFAVSLLARPEPKFAQIRQASRKFAKPGARMILVRPGTCLIGEFVWWSCMFFFPDSTHPQKAFQPDFGVCWGLARLVSSPLYTQKAEIYSRKV